MKRTFNLFVLITLLALNFGAAGVTPAYAATLTVTNTNDSGAGSLRQAIADAASGDTITFDAGLSGQTITLTSGELAIAKDLTIDGSALASQVTISGNNTSRVFNISSGSVTLNNLTIAYGNSDWGGGLNSGTYGTVTITNSTFHHNYGTVIGAIHVYYTTLVVSNSTFDQNSSPAGFAGGIALRDYSNANISNSTFSGNTGSAAGGVFAGWYSTLTLNNNTFSGNITTAVGNGGALTVDSWTSVYLTNNIFANSTSDGVTPTADCYLSSSIYTLSSVNNLVEIDSAAPNSCAPAVTGDPLLNALASNGGPTDTMSLQAGSWALGMGDAATCAAAPVNNLDQRGQSRPQGGGNCDIGAYESSLMGIFHTVTFHANGGSGTMADQVAIAPTALVLNAFTRSGYSFAGWDTAADGSGTSYADGATYDFSADMTLYAQWNALPVIDIVSPITSNGSNLFSTISLSDAENNPLSGVIQILIGKGAPISAVFETLDTCGSGAPMTYTLNGVVIGSSASNGTCQCDPPVDSATITGAPLTSNFNLSSSNIFGYTTSEYPLTAWSRVTLTYADSSTETACIFDATGTNCTTMDLCAGYTSYASGTVSVASSTTVLASQPYTNSTLPVSLDVSAIAPGDYTLYADTSDGINSPVSDTESITLAGEGLLYINASTVTFDGNGGSGTMAPQVSGVPAALNANTFTRTDYTFAGWSTTPTDAVVYSDGATYDFSADITLYAQWTPINHTVTFNGNGNDGGSMAPQTASAPTALTLNGFTRTGYSFAGWGTVPGGPVVYADGANYDFSADITLFAQWTLNSYTVSFDAQGGSPTPVNQTVAYGALVTDPGTPARASHIFNGWFTAPSGGTQWNFASNTMGAGDMTLFAQWTAYTELSATFTSLGAYDGYMLEPSENANTGFLAPVANPNSMVGDHSLDRQVRSLLHFNTASLPDNAVITGITIKVKRQLLFGNPFSLGNLQVDVASPFFGAEIGLKPADFQAVPSAANVGFFNPTPATGNWYSAVLDPAAFPFLNLTGATQYRLAFSMDDNDNGRADWFMYYSGNFRTVSYQPVLIVSYYIPAP